jgi:quinol monooxygenase YgiN
MPAVVVVSRLFPQAGRLQDVLEVLNSSVARIHAEEPGCLLYAAHRARGDDNGPVVMVEKFASEEAFEVHGSSPTLVEFGPKLQALLDAPIEVVVLDPVPLGEGTKGRI